MLERLLARHEGSVRKKRAYDRARSWEMLPGSHLKSLGRVAHVRVDGFRERCGDREGAPGRGRGKDAPPRFALRNKNRGQSGEPLEAKARLRVGGQHWSGKDEGLLKAEFLAA